MLEPHLLLGSAAHSKNGDWGTILVAHFCHLLETEGGASDQRMARLRDFII